MAEPVEQGVRQACQRALGVAAKLFAAESFAEAWGACQAAAAIDPANPGVHNAAGVVLCKLGRQAEAVRSFLLALQSLPREPSLHSNLGNAYLELLEYDLAEKAHRQALALAPGNAQFLRHLADTLARRGREEQAIRLYEEVLARAPEDATARWGLATSLLRAGRLRQGWEQYEHRWSLNPKNPPRGFAQPRWEGEPFPGRTLLLYGEQGMGDTLHGLRYLPLVKELGGRVVLEVHAELVRLCAEAGGADLVLARGRGAPPADFDLHCPLLSCPRIFSPSLAGIPARHPYLRPPAEARKRLAPLLASAGGRLKVGIIWSGNPEFPENRHRAVALGELLSSLDLPGVQLYSLQKGPAAAELERTPGAGTVADLAPECRDFADTAGAMSLLDLVVMTDTGAAHLCGGLDRPLWLLLPFFAHWVWGPPGETACPWYPSARLFRQDRPGRWAEPLARVRAGLEALLATRATDTPPAQGPA